VLLLEREAQPGMHSTGRSAAMFMESYGPPQVRALTRASRAFYEAPPPGFADAAILAPRGALYAAWQGQEAALDALHASLSATGIGGGAHRCRRVPAPRAGAAREGLLGGVFEVDAMDIDVHALHQGSCAAPTRRCRAWTDAELARGDNAGGTWQLVLADGRRCSARTLINAAGAWADEVARRCGVAPLGIQPKRRSAFTFAAPAGLDIRPWPTVCNVRRAGTSSPTPASCSARRPTPTRCRRTTWCPRSSTSPPASRRSRPTPR
jgi:D-arginine dehydrogenase